MISPDEKSWCDWDEIIKNIRWWSIALVWVETGLSIYLCRRQMSFIYVKGKRWPPSPTIARYPYYPKGAYIASQMIETNYLRTRIMQKLYESVNWTVILLADILPMMWEFLSSTGGKYDFTPGYLDMNMRRTFLFAFWWAVMESLLIILPLMIMDVFHEAKFAGDYRKTLISGFSRVMDTVIRWAMYDAFRNFLFALMARGLEKACTRLNFPLPLQYIILFFAFALFQLCEIVPLLADILLHSSPFQYRKWSAETGIKLKAVCDEAECPFKYVEIGGGLGGFMLSFFCLGCKIFLGYETVTRWKIEEAEAVLAHEVGHWKLSHVESRVLMEFCILSPLTYVAAMRLRQEPDMYASYNFELPEECSSGCGCEDFAMCQAALPFLPGLFVANFVCLRWLRKLFDSFLTMWTCQHEGEADMYATVDLNRGKGLADVLVRLFTEYPYYFPLADWLYSLFNNDHPPLETRLIIAETVTGPPKPPPPPPPPPCEPEPASPYDDTDDEEY